MINQKELIDYNVLEGLIKDLDRQSRDLKKKKKEMESKFVAEGPLGTGDIEDGELTLMIREEPRAPRLSKDNIVKTIGEPAYEQLMGSLRLKCKPTITNKFTVAPINDIFG